MELILKENINYNEKYFDKVTKLENFLSMLQEEPNKIFGYNNYLNYN